MRTQNHRSKEIALRWRDHLDIKLTAGNVVAVTLLSPGIIVLIVSEFEHDGLHLFLPLIH